MLLDDELDTDEYEEESLVIEVPPELKVCIDKENLAESDQLPKKLKSLNNIQDLDKIMKKQAQVQVFKLVVVRGGLR